MFRRGFKSWAEQTSARVRQKLQLLPASPLDPRNLAVLLSVDVLTPENMDELPGDVKKRLLNEHSDFWSAITVTTGRNHLIIVNPSHASTRLNNSLAHELAHIILDHEPSMMYISPNSGLALRTHNEDQEDEANWLAGCLLLPREALLEVRRRRMTDDDVCAEYGVSASVLRYRLNITGVDVQFRRMRRRRGRGM